MNDSNDMIKLASAAALLSAGGDVNVSKLVDAIASNDINKAITKANITIGIVINVVRPRAHPNKADTVLGVMGDTAVMTIGPGGPADGLAATGCAASGVVIASAKDIAISNGDGSSEDTTTSENALGGSDKDVESAKSTSLLGPERGISIGVNSDASGGPIIGDAITLKNKLMSHANAKN